MRSCVARSGPVLSCLSRRQGCCECGASAGGAGEPKRRITSVRGLVPGSAAAALGGAGAEDAPSGGTGVLREVVSGIQALF